MVFRSGSTAPEPPETTLQAADGGSPSVSVSPAMILLIATWVGLVAGWLDLGLMVVERRLIRGEFYRLGEHFVWLIPLGVAVLMIVPGTVLALIAGLRRRGVRPGTAVGLLAFVGFLDMCAAAALVGLGVTPALRGGGNPVRSAGRCPPPGDPRAGAPDDAVAHRRPAGGHAGEDRRAGLVGASGDGRLAAASRGCPERAADRLGHGPGRESQPLRLCPPTTPNLERFAGRGVRFDLAFSTSSWTLPSHASLFTGRWPHELGVGWTTPSARASRPSPSTSAPAAMTPPDS